MIAVAEDGLNSIVDINEEPAGALTIILPAFMAGSFYEHAIWDFVRQHQAVAVTIRYLDRNFDLVVEGIDLALRMGELPESALRSRRLGRFEWNLVCAPSYLNARPKIETPDDLKGVEFIVVEGLADQVHIAQVRCEESTVHQSRSRACR